MAERDGRGNRGRGRPLGRGQGHRSAAPGRRPGAGAPKKPGSLGLRRVEGEEFELVHPRCVLDRELDYLEGIEIWKAGDPEGARDALRYALQGCGDNLWVHVALGRIALQEFRDPTLARGHFGYAFELAQRVLPRGFRGRLPARSPANRPLHDAAEGLASCYEALGHPDQAADVRAQVSRWDSGPPPRPSG